MASSLRVGRFGPVPPSERELVESFLGPGVPFLFTGPARWNALGLGTTALFAVPLVYTAVVEGRRVLDGLPVVFRREAFPEVPTPEWFAVDLFNHADEAGADPADLARELVRALSRGAFDREHLREMVARYGTPETQARIGRVVA